MSDTEDTTPSDTPRDGVTGRYVSGRQEGAPAGKAGDDGETTQSPPPPPAAGGDANKDDAGKEDEKEGRKRWLLLLLLLLILLLLLCAGFVYMKWFKKEPSTTPTPSPTAVVQTTQAAPSPTPSVTASASPSPSASPTVKTAAMPDVVGKPAAEAKTIIEAAGFSSIKFVDESNGNSLDLLVSYTVTKQSVAAGTQVPVDTALTITAKSSSSGLG